MTSRLVLEPVTVQLARAVVAGRLSDIPAGARRPHVDTADAMAMALSSDLGPSWVVTVAGVVIGGCGGFSWPDEGVVEIGYGRAEPFRGNGYSTEADAGNDASRRVLEKLGFEPIDENDLHVSYRLEHKTKS